MTRNWERIPSVHEKSLHKQIINLSHFLQTLKSLWRWKCSEILPSSLRSGMLKFCVNVVGAHVPSEFFMFFHVFKTTVKL